MMTRLKPFIDACFGRFYPTILQLIRHKWFSVFILVC